VENHYQCFIRPPRLILWALLRHQAFDQLNHSVHQITEDWDWKYQG
jgi:hypothetical protein